MSAPTTERVYGGEEGWYQVLVKHPDGRRKDVTLFRGVPTVIENYSWADPFSEATASMSFPEVTSYDRPGTGDLWWLVPWAQVTINWVVANDRGGYQQSGWSWEGIFASEEVSTDSYAWQLKGALHEADNFKAAPFFPQLPVPYELLIKRSLSKVTHPTLRTAPLLVQWPKNWAVRVPRFNEPSYLWFLRPWGVSPGARWSGLTTRNTGSWDNVLTGHVQSLLQSMYTPEGDQWTILNQGNRTPVLQVRRPGKLLEVINGVPGVKVSASRDFSQSANVIYGSGSDLAGTTFSGAQVSPDGETTFYEPFAALPSVHPQSASNTRLVKSVLRKEAQLQFAAGIDQYAAREVAAAQIRRFADPGYNGSIELQVDPISEGKLFNRRLIKAGMSIAVSHFRGTTVTFHVTSVSVNAATGDVQLTVDTKFRDALTSHEVRARTRDALDPVRLLKAGSSSVTVQDLRKPWSYAEGSGVIPSGGKEDATKLFNRMPDTLQFPWLDYTRRYPPRTHPQYYVTVGRKGPKARDRWQNNGYVQSAVLPRSYGFPIKAAERGNIRLIQLAAYNLNGEVVPVRFHFSIYTNSGVTSTDMPKLDRDRDGYAAADNYPFFAAAWDRIKPNGEEQDNPNVLLPSSANFVIGWGNFYEPAGYSPGLASAGAIKTGRLIDESPWSFDTSGDPSFDRYSTQNNAKNKSAGMLYGMIFCDDLATDVFFMGRMFIAPMGAN